jgi:hypothetical protein
VRDEVALAGMMREFKGLGQLGVLMGACYFATRFIGGFVSFPCLFQTSSQTLKDVNGTIQPLANVGHQLFFAAQTFGDIEGQSYAIASLQPQRLRVA